VPGWWRIPTVESSGSLWTSVSEADLRWPYPSYADNLLKNPDYLH